MVTYRFEARAAWVTRHHFAAVADAAPALAELVPLATHRLTGGADTQVLAADLV